MKLPGLPKYKVEEYRKLRDAFLLLGVLALVLGVVMGVVMCRMGWF